MNLSESPVDPEPKLTTKVTHLRDNDDISDKEVEILNQIRNKITKSDSLGKMSSVEALNNVNSDEYEKIIDYIDDWTVSENIEKGDDATADNVAEKKAKLKKTRNKKACDVCKKKKIKCIYNFDDDRCDDVDEKALENTVIPSNKQYLGIVCAYCKKNKTKCTFLAPERKRGYKRVTEDKENVPEISDEPLPKKKKKQLIKEEVVNENIVEPQEVNFGKRRAPKLSNNDRLKKFQQLFDAMFNSNGKKNNTFNIDTFDPELFKKIYNNINHQDTTLNSYEFDGSRNNALNNNHFQIAIDRYDYFLHHNLTKGSAQEDNLKFFSLQVPLPSKERAITLIENAWLESFVVFRFYHRPTFIANLHRLYSLKPHEYDEQLVRFLPSLYSVMAVGSLFDNNKEGINFQSEKAVDEDDEGYRFFLAARNMIDLSNCTDINSIQTIVMLFMFLQCSARLSTCYIYIGIAMRSALREGYHRFIPEGTPGYSLLDIEMRKRTFFTIYKMDIYVNNMLGLPKAISYMDFDQTLPLEYEDEYITHEGLKLPQDYDPHKSINSVSISNHHTKLLMILEEVVDKLYPVKKTNNVIPHKVVTELEIKLDNWIRQLPKFLIPGMKESEIPNEYLFKANRLLHFSFLQVQIVLYRPFIHYLILDKRQSLEYDELSMKRAEMCKNVAKKAILLAKEMLQKQLLNGNHWFSIYTIFFSVAGLLFYVHESTPDLTNSEEIADYNECNRLSVVAKTILNSLKGSSKAANRTYNVLNTLFDSLNKRTKMYMEMSFKKNETPRAANSDDVKNASSQRNEPESLQKYAGTPLSDTMSMFMQAAAAEYPPSNYYTTDVGISMTDGNDQKSSTLQLNQQNMLTPSGKMMDESPFSGMNTPYASNIMYPSNTQNSQGSANGSAYIPHMFDTVSGNNLPLPVIQERVDIEENRLNQAKDMNHKKEEIGLGINSETIVNNPAFDINMSPVNIISDEQVMEETQRGVENKASPMLLMKNTEAETKKSNDIEEEKPDTMYISGVFDQLDMQLFGRYLPPYMTRNVNKKK